MAGGHHAASAVSLLTLALLAIPPRAPAPAPVSTPVEPRFPIQVDGDLTDMLAAIQANLGPAQGGFRAESPAVEIGLKGTRGCETFVNGFDLDGVYAWIDYRNPDGSTRRDAQGRPDVTLYLGWRVQGQIGDVDGDGDPDRATRARPDCFKVLPGRNASQEIVEYYQAALDLSCAGEFRDPTQRIVIAVVATASRSAAQLVLNPHTPTRKALPGSFAYQNAAVLKDPSKGHALEARIDHLQTYLPPGTDLGRVTLAFAAGAQHDGLAEDEVRPGFVFTPPPEVRVARAPEDHGGCPGAAVDWTITVRNDGLSQIERIDVTDVLDPGLRYVGDSHGSTGDARSRAWTLDALAPGASVAIQVHAAVDAPCGAPLTDRASATATTACDSTGTLIAAPGAGQEVLPREFELYANSPNPFAVGTTLRLALPEASQVLLAVYSVTGRREAVVMDGKYPAGVRSFVWRAAGADGRPLAAGVYYGRLTATGMGSGRRFSKTLRMVVMR